MATHGKFACPGCGRRYRWKPRLAGKRVRCKCKTAFDAPEQSPASAAVASAASGSPREGSTRLTEAVDTQGRTCPNCGTTAGADAVICVHCGHNLVTGAQVQSTVIADGGVARRSGIVAHLIHFGFWIAILVAVMPPLSYLHAVADANQILPPISYSERRQQERAEERLETYSLADWAMRGVYFGVPLGLLMGVLRYRRAGAVDPWAWLQRAGTSTPTTDHEQARRHSTFDRWSGRL